MVLRIGRNVNWSGEAEITDPKIGHYKKSRAEARRLYLRNGAVLKGPRYRCSGYSGSDRRNLRMVHRMAPTKNNKKPHRNMITGTMRRANVQ